MSLSNPTPLIGTQLVTEYQITFIPDAVNINNGMYKLEFNLAPEVEITTMPSLEPEDNLPVMSDVNIVLKKMESGYVSNNPNPIVTYLGKDSAPLNGQEKNFNINFWELDETDPWLNWPFDEQTQITVNPKKKTKVLVYKKPIVNAFIRFLKKILDFFKKLFSN